MTLIVADKVWETTTTTGTGALALAGAVTGYRTFDDVCANNDTCYYSLWAVDGSGNPTGDWETGLGTFTDTDTLTRTTVHASSNSNNAVNFAAGTKYVQLTASATYLASISTIAIEEEGVEESAAVARLNFTGSGVDVSVSGSEATVSISGAGDTLIETYTGDGTAASKTFSSLGSYTSLRLEMMIRGTDGATSATQLNVQFNGDTGSNYDAHLIGTTGTTAGNVASQAVTTAQIGGTSSGLAPADEFGFTVLEIPNYRSTSFKKKAQTRSSYKATDTATAFVDYVGSITWRSTAAITSITVILAAGNFATGSVMRLYGVS